ncbi:hypothetical protein [Bradyrhizobium viridifuturi]|uniref:hypothetical protein n=1 Tax=Bradyrhizobium viridifuturi TaxID=1654716 RepID=UPI001FCE11D1|nr:hypothetical protein [Bradyrhizobium viridifuturi]
MSVTARRREIEVRGPDLPQRPEHRPRHARQMPHVLEFGEPTLDERVPDRGFQVFGRSGDGKAAGKPCSQLRQAQDLETAVADLRRRETAHLERQGPLHHRRPELG